MWVLFILLGVASTISNTNEILLIPSFVEYLLYGLGGVLFVGKVIVYCFSMKTTRKITKHFR